MSNPERNKATVLKFYEESHRGNLEVYDTMLASDFINHGVGPIPDMHGPEEFKQAYIVYKTAFPDFDTPPEIVIAEGDYVMIYGPAVGTHLGDFMGLPPTGKKLRWSGVSIYRLNEEGMIVERWQELNALGLMQQLGMIPPMGGGR